MIRPRYSPFDTAADHQDKSELKRHQRTAVTRSSVDRLENLLAVIGYLRYLCPEEASCKFT